MSLALMILFLSLLSAQNRKHIVLGQDDVLGPVNLHFVARVLAEEDAIAALDGQRPHFAILLHLARARRDYQALDRLLFGRVRDEEAALGLLFLRDAFDYEAIGKGTDFHGTRTSIN